MKKTPVWIDGMKAFFSNKKLYKEIKSKKNDDENVIVVAPKLGDFCYGMLYAKEFKKESGKKLAICCPEKFVKYVESYGCADRIITYPNSRLYAYRFFIMVGLKATFHPRKEAKDGIYFTLPAEKKFKGNTLKEVYRDHIFMVKNDKIQLLNIKQTPKVTSIENFDEIKDKVVVINPYSNSHFHKGLDLMQPIADLLTENGYIVYTNAIGKQKPLKNTKPLGCPVDELFEIANNCRAFISIRSGVADFLVDTKCFMVLTYVKEPHFRFTHSLKDLGKTNIEECFCKNEKDIQSLKNIVVENIIEKDKQ